MIFYDLVLFFYNTLYQDLVNSLSLFPFLSLVVNGGYSLVEVLATFITLSIFVMFVLFFVGIFVYILKMIKGVFL